MVVFFVVFILFCLIYSFFYFTADFVNMCNKVVWRSLVCDAYQIQATKSVHKDSSVPVEEKMAKIQETCERFEADLKDGNWEDVLADGQTAISTTTVKWLKQYKKSKASGEVPDFEEFKKVCILFYLFSIGHLFLFLAYM